MPNKKVLIAGGTGLVGSDLTELLLKKGYDVSILTRKPVQNSKIPAFHCNYKQNSIDKDAVNSADIIINLAGANIADKRWSKKRKIEILESRVKTNELIFSALDKQNNKLQTFISASAVGYYAAVTTDKEFKETDNPHNDFLANVCNEWEKSADLFQDVGIRTVKMRTGVVLSPQKGALEQIQKSFKFGVQVILGSGNQYFPWVHIYDLCNMYIKAIENNNLCGAYNAVSPDYQTYKSFVVELSRFYKTILKIKVPAPFLRFTLGEMAVILLEGSRVSPKKIIDTGFDFKYVNLRDALSNLFDLDS